jgi:hypothetical protein
MAKLMDTGRCDNDLKNKFNAMKRKKIITEKDLSGPAAELIAFVQEVNAAEAEAPAEASAELPRRRQRAASEDSDNGSASEAEAPQQPDRPRRQRKAPLRLTDEQAPPAATCAPPVLDLFPDCEPTPLVYSVDELLSPWGDEQEQLTLGCGEPMPELVDFNIKGAMDWLDSFDFGEQLSKERELHETQLSKERELRETQLSKERGLREIEVSKERELREKDSAYNARGGWWTR